MPNKFEEALENIGKQAAAVIMETAGKPGYESNVLNVFQAVWDVVRTNIGNIRPPPPPAG